MVGSECPLGIRFESICARIDFLTYQFRQLDEAFESVALLMLPCDGKQQLQVCIHQIDRRTLDF
ncbi:hypothetical protein BOC35_28805 [Burkholderia pseudomallei]|nr:hypothetical protein BOC35_28805 [Burkholderia pseudomallei]